MLNDERDPADPTGPGGSPRDMDAHSGASSADAGERYDIAGVALGVLSPEEAAAVLAAAENDPAIAKDLAELQAVVAELARLTPGPELNRGRSAGIRSRLVTRAAASRAGRPVTRQAGPLASIAPARGGTPELISASRPPHGAPERRGTTRLSTERRVSSRPIPPGMVERRGRFWKRTLGVLAAAAVIITGAGVFALWRERSVRGPQQVAAATPAVVHDTLLQTIATLRAELARRDSMLTAMRSPRTRVVDLASYSPPSPPGRVFWDQAHQHWMLSIDDLKPPPPGHTYQLWVIARGHAQPMSAGTFAPDSSGRAEMISQLAVEPGRLRRVVVTDEPEGGSPAPTGPILFAGR